MAAARIVKCQWQGHVFSAELIEKRPDGSLLMRARSHGPRFTSGSRIVVQPGELLEPIED